MDGKGVILPGMLTTQGDTYCFFYLYTMSDGVIYSFWYNEERPGGCVEFEIVRGELYENEVVLA